MCFLRFPALQVGSAVPAVSLGTCCLRYSGSRSRALRAEARPGRAGLGRAPYAGPGRGPQPPGHERARDNKAAGPAEGPRSQGCGEGTARDGGRRQPPSASARPRGCSGGRLPGGPGGSRGARRPSRVSCTPPLCGARSGRGRAVHFRAAGPGGRAAGRLGTRARPAGTPGAPAELTRGGGSGSAAVSMD